MNRHSFKLSLYALAASVALPIVGAGCAGANTNSPKGIHEAKVASEEALNVASSHDAWSAAEHPNVPNVNDAVLITESPLPNALEGEVLRPESSDNPAIEPVIEALEAEKAEREAAHAEERAEDAIEDAAEAAARGPITSEDIRIAIRLDGCSKHSWYSNWYYGNKPVCQEWKERDPDAQGMRHYAFIDHSIYGRGWDSHGPRGVYDAYDAGRFEYYRVYGEGGGFDEFDSQDDWYWEGRFIRHFQDWCFQKYGRDLVKCALPQELFSDYIDAKGTRMHCEGFWDGNDCSTSVHWNLFDGWCRHTGSEALFCKLLKGEPDDIIEDLRERADEIIEDGDWKRDWKRHEK